MLSYFPYSLTCNLTKKYPSDAGTAYSFLLQVAIIVLG